LVLRKYAPFKIRPFLESLITSGVFMSSRFQLANAIRALSMDAVQKANSGHPGAPMGMADIAQVVWGDHLKHNPNNPEWVNRDRFVLSNGHGSMLIYSLLHLTGYALSIDDLKNFRQLHSKTPGHPELGYTPGVETTTGPLGQGLANAIGMAMAERVAIIATTNISSTKVKPPVKGLRLTLVWPMTSSALLFFREPINLNRYNVIIFFSILHSVSRIEKNGQSAPI
jgi:hypothetical protein